jgi:hypothetical protein
MMPCFITLLYGSLFTYEIFAVAEEAGDRN